MNGKGFQICEVIKKSGREECEIVSMQSDRWMMREGLGKRNRQKLSADREERLVNKSE